MAADPQHPNAPTAEAAPDAAADAPRGGNLRAEVLARMGHELRTPLNAIIGFIKLVEEGLYTTEEERRDYLASARQSALTLLDLINNILDLARIEAGRLSLESVEVNVAEMVEEVAKTLAPEAHAKGVEIDAIVDPSLPPRLKSDPLRLRQVLYNLAGNAVKFTDTGLVLLRADVEATGGEATRVRFAVRDTGVGVPPDVQPVIFESFVQTPASGREHLGGVGLGLSIAKQIVEQMGGTIALESHVNRGSTFWFSVLLPSGKAQEGPARDLRLPDAHLLLVNPDSVTTEPTLAKLRTLDAGAEAVATPAAALAALEQAEAAGTPFRAVLVDHHLRRDEALVFARQVRRREGAYQPDLVHLTIIGASADTTDLREAGYNGFVTKPITADSLRAVLSALMERQGPQGVGPAAGRTEPATPVVRTRPRHGYVLVAEDNVVNQKLIQALLSKQGYGTRLVANGQEALDALGQEGFDLVLMDVQMPVLDGLATARAIRERPQYGDLPIIAMTADALDGDRERCLAAGMNDHVPKPIMPDVLNATLAQWLAAPVAAAAGGAGAGRTEAADVPGAGEADLDLAHLDAVRAYAQDHDPGRFTALLDLFRTEAHAALSDLVQARQRQNWAQTRAAARRLELATAGFGAPRLHALAVHLARQAAAEAAPTLEAALPSAESALQSLELALAARYAPEDPERSGT